MRVVEALKRDEPHAEVGDATQPHADVLDVDALRLGLEFSWM